MITIPFRQIGDFIMLYLMQNFENKIVIIADIIYWVIALSIDVFVFVRGLDAYWLILGTGIAYLVYDIFLLYKSHILSDKFDKLFIKEAFMKGKDIVIDRTTGKVATLAYVSMASSLSKELYAIHCIAYGITCNLEEFTVQICMVHIFLQDYVY